MKSRHVPVIAGWFLVTAIVSGQAPPKPWPFTETLATLKQDNPAAALAALQHLRDSRQRALDDAAFVGMYFDLLATTSSFVGDHRGALLAESEYFAHAEKLPAVTADFNGFHAVPASDAIIQASTDRRVVMLNEEHRLSMQRSFLADLIPDLRRKGFTHLAMEALGEDGAAVQRRGYAVLETGLYTRDPQLAEAVRLAISLGMQVVKYEPDPRDVGREPGDRDRRSASSLAAVLRQEPESRIVVYAGRYHIAKQGDKTWTPLAARLREMTGIDPLCIDLIAMRECQRPEDELPAYRAALDKGLVANAPVVLVDAEGRRYSHWPEMIDFSVCFPRTIDRDGRPDWLARGRRHPVSIADHVRSSTELLLARADRPGELPTAIPADQVLLPPGKPAPNLMLPPGRFTVRILNAEGRAQSEFEVNAPP